MSIRLYSEVPEQRTRQIASDVVVVLLMWLVIWALWRFLRLAMRRLRALLGGGGDSKTVAG